MPISSSSPRASTASRVDSGKVLSWRLAPAAAHPSEMPRRVTIGLPCWQLCIRILTILAGICLILGCSDNTVSEANGYNLPEFSCDNEASAERFLLSFFESLSRKDAVAARSHIGSEEANFYAFVIYPDVVRDDRYHPLNYSQYGISTIDPQINAVIRQIERTEPYRVELFEYYYSGGSERSGSEAHFRYEIKRGLLHQQVVLKGKGAFNCHEKKIVALIMVTHYGDTARSSQE